MYRKLCAKAAFVAPKLHWQRESCAKHKEKVSLIQKGIFSCKTSRKAHRLIKGSDSGSVAATVRVAVAAAVATVAAASSSVATATATTTTTTTVRMREAEERLERLTLPCVVVYVRNVIVDKPRIRKSGEACAFTNL